MGVLQKIKNRFITLSTYIPSGYVFKRKTSTLIYFILFYFIGRVWILTFFLIMLSFHRRKTISMWWLPLNLFVFKEIPFLKIPQKKSSNQTHIAQSHWKCLSLYLSLFPLSSEISFLFALGAWSLLDSVPTPIPGALYSFVHWPAGCTLSRRLFSKCGSSACWVPCWAGLGRARPGNTSVN